MTDNPTPCPLCHQPSDGQRVGQDCPVGSDLRETFARIVRSAMSDGACAVTLSTSSDDWNEMAESYTDQLIAAIRDTEVHALTARIKRLEDALREAREDMQGWAGYADEYFQTKHDLAGDLAKIDATLNEGEG